LNVLIKGEIRGKKKKNQKKMTRFGVGNCPQDVTQQEGERGKERGVSFCLGKEGKKSINNNTSSGFVVSSAECVEDMGEGFQPVVPTREDKFSPSTTLKIPFRVRKKEKEKRGKGLAAQAV